MVAYSGSSNLKDSSSLITDVRRKSFNSVVENGVTAVHEVILLQGWEVLRVGEASSVVVLLVVPSSMSGMSKWNLDLREASLFTSSLFEVRILSTSVKAEIVASVNHGSNVLIDVSKLGFVKWLRH